MFTCPIARNILKNWSQIIRWRGLLKITDPKAKVVAVNGCFDVLHAGHVSMLQTARSFGDYLVVGINSDWSVRQLKGPKRPINNQDNRQKVLQALRCVDFVQIFDDVLSTRFLMVARPHIYVKSKDYNINSINVEERKMLEDMKTDIRFVDLVSHLSSTSIINQL